jgi:hypothetical protein
MPSRSLRATLAVHRATSLSGAGAQPAISVAATHSTVRVGGSAMPRGYNTRFSSRILGDGGIVAYTAAGVLRGSR